MGAKLFSRFCISELKVLACVRTQARHGVLGTFSGKAALFTLSKAARAFAERTLTLVQPAATRCLHSMKHLLTMWLRLLVSRYCFPSPFFPPFGGEKTGSLSLPS